MLPKQRAAVWTMGLRWVPKCHPHPTDNKGIVCLHSPNRAEGWPVLPLTKDSPDRFLLETVLEVGVERWKNK